MPGRTLPKIRALRTKALEYPSLLSFVLARCACIGGVPGPISQKRCQPSGTTNEVRPRSMSPCAALRVTNVLRFTDCHQQHASPDKCHAIVRALSAPITSAAVPSRIAKKTTPSGSADGVLSVYPVCIESKLRLALSNAL